jgi:hypothetical protein
MKYFSTKHNKKQKLRLLGQKVSTAIASSTWVMGVLTSILTFILSINAKIHLGYSQ